MGEMSIDYEKREAMKALRGKLSKRATSSEFNEWMAREICEYIDALIDAQKWRSIETAPKNESILVFIPNVEHYGPGVYRGVLFDKGTGPRWHVSGLHMGRDCGPDTMPIGWLPLPLPPLKEQGEQGDG